MGRTKEEILEAMKPKRNGNGHRRPEGGISIREAARKYGVSRSNLSRWAKQGILPVLQRTENWLYVDEVVLRELIQK